MRIYLIILTGLFLTTCASSNVTSNEEKIEDLIAAGKDIVIEDRTFDRDIDFTDLAQITISEGINQVRIVSSITFINCTFNGKVIAYSRNSDNITTITAFQSSLSFIGCVFNEDVNFKASSIMGRVDFTRAAFFGIANFEEVTFFQNAYFRASTYHKEVRFQNAVFMQKANFMNAEFDETASFQRAVFHSEGQFSSTRFMGYTDFGNISCFGNFFANYAEFADRLIFNNAYLYRMVDVMNLSLNYCEMKKCRFFGDVRFMNSTVKDEFQMQQTVFVLGVPDLGSFDKDKLIQSE